MTSADNKQLVRRMLREGWIRIWPASYHAYSEWVRKKLPDHPMNVDCRGFRMTIRSPQTSVIGRSILRDGLWEPEVTRFAEAEIKPGWVVLDVGADIGYYTLLFAQLVGASGRVVAFEPIQDSRRLLEQNAALNGWNWIEIQSCALAERRGTAHISLESRGRLSAQGSGEDVELVPLDELWPSLGLARLDLIKIDVEGAEMGVLRGMEKVLRRFSPRLLLELHPDYLPKFDASVGSVLTFLKQNGYRFRPVDAPTIEGRVNNTTVWCVPAGGAADRAAS